MIRSFAATNFRCYQKLYLEGFTRLNVFVGDNGVGKTSLLEGLFLPLATATDVALRLRQYRGNDAALSGSPRRVEEAVVGDLFYNYNMRAPITLQLEGEGPEARSLTIQRSRDPTAELPGMLAEQEPDRDAAPVYFVWRSASGNTYPVPLNLQQSDLSRRATNEDMNRFFHFAANVQIGAAETAERFSQLSQKNRQEIFESAFRQEYPWISSISVEVMAGAAGLYAGVTTLDRKLPLTSVSGGINRIISVLLAISAEDKGVVLVDEIENGIFHTHHEATWRLILASLVQSQSQMFVSTHSHEALLALVAAAGDHINEVSLWRIERANRLGGQPVIRRFGGSTLKAGVLAGTEVR